MNFKELTKMANENKVQIKILFSPATRNEGEFVLMQGLHWKKVYHDEFIWVPAVIYENLRAGNFVSGEGLMKTISDWYLLSTPSYNIKSEMVKLYKIINEKASIYFESQKQKYPKLQDFQLKIKTKEKIDRGVPFIRWSAEILLKVEKIYGYSGYNLQFWGYGQ